MFHDPVIDIHVSYRDFIVYNHLRCLIFQILPMIEYVHSYSINSGRISVFSESLFDEASLNQLAQ